LPSGPSKNANLDINTLDINISKWWRPCEKCVEFKHMGFNKVYLGLIS